MAEMTAASLEQRRGAVRARLLTVLDMLRASVNVFSGFRFPLPLLGEKSMRCLYRTAHVFIGCVSGKASGQP